MGHIIMTGVGLTAALQALGVMIKSDRPASETFRAFEPVPQLLKNLCIHGDTKRLSSRGVKRALPPLRPGRRPRPGAQLGHLVMVEGDESSLLRKVVEQDHRSPAARLGVTFVDS